MKHVKKMWVEEKDGELKDWRNESAWFEGYEEGLKDFEIEETTLLQFIFWMQEYMRIIYECSKHRWGFIAFLPHFIPSN